MVTCWGGQAAVAALGAAIVPRLRVVHAMGACSASGCVLSLAAAAHLVLRGEGDAAFPTAVGVSLPAIIVGGAVLALPAALAASLAAGGIGRLAGRRSSRR